MTFKKFSSTLVAVATSALFSGIVALGAEPEKPAARIRPIKITSAASLPDDLPSELGLSSRQKASIQYLVEGSAIVGVDEITIDSIKLSDGREVAKFRNGKEAWRRAAFPKVSTDGRFAVFELEIERTLFGTLDGTLVQGSAVIHQGSDREELIVEIDLKKKQPIDVGPFKLVVDPEPGAGIVFGGGSDKSYLQLAITAGPTKSVVECKLFDGERELPPSVMFGGDQKSYSVPRPLGPTLKVKLSYWKSFEGIKVPLGR